MAPCFATPLSATARPAFLTGAPAASPAAPAPSAPRAARATPRAELKLTPGIPSGQDPLDNAPLRHFVPRPAETYEDRGFATLLPRTWEGETDTIGVSDIEPVTKESLEEARQVPVDAAATGAFVEYARSVKDERAAMLEEQKRRSTLGQTGRATCGEEEGKAFVSNYKTVLVDGVKCVEYWGVANGPVPRLFGGPGQ